MLSCWPLNNYRMYSEPKRCNESHPTVEKPMATFDDLQRTLQRIDSRGYKAYKELIGKYIHANFTLYIDHVQGDPFAAPSKIRLRVPSAFAKIPHELFSNSTRRIALQDFLIRTVHGTIHRVCHGHRGMGKSGLASIDVGGQEVLERTAMVVTEAWIEARMEVGLPARGRTILGRQAEAMLCDELPEIVEQSMSWGALDQLSARVFVDCVENQEAIREQLRSLELVGFVADGAILPRASGASDHPLKGASARAFQSPESLRVRISIPHETDQHGQPTKELTGLGIPKGVTLIVGGGYHGKSTLLRAIERGVYPHIPGDGREYVVTLNTAVKVRAEDGRRIEQLDMSGFINNLPFGKDTTDFSTNNASGSTSQAATILEAMEVGVEGLLLDEDTSATNFLVRDARMQALVHKAHEPITPLIDRIHELSDEHAVSTVLVMGGCGDYFDVADTVIMMREFQPVVVTGEAHQIAQEHDTQRAREVLRPLNSICSRSIHLNSIDASSGKRDIKIDAKSLTALVFGQESLDLGGVEQIVDVSQTRAIGFALPFLAQRMGKSEIGVKDAVALIDDLFTQDGLDGLDPFYQAERHPGNFARPRPYEIAAAINRLRSIRLRHS